MGHQYGGYNSGIGLYFAAGGEDPSDPSTDVDEVLVVGKEETSSSLSVEEIEKLELQEVRPEGLDLGVDLDDLDDPFADSVAEPPPPSMLGKTVGHLTLVETTELPKDVVQYNTSEETDGEGYLLGYKAGVDAAISSLSDFIRTMAMSHLDDVA